MKRIPDETCASICGLFCGACPAFPNECHGCFSDYVREGCKGLHIVPLNKIEICGGTGKWGFRQAIAADLDSIEEGYIEHFAHVPAASLYKKLGFHLVSASQMKVGGMISHNRHLFFEKIV